MEPRSIAEIAARLEALDWTLSDNEKMNVRQTAKSVEYVMISPFNISASDI
jgi:hypothetical protein